MFAVGLAVGAAAAALYAPVSGPALRKRLSKAAGEGTEMAKDALNQADGFVREKSDAARKIVNRSGEAFRQVRDEVASAAE